MLQHSFFCKKPVIGIVKSGKKYLLRSGSGWKEEKPVGLGFQFHRIRKRSRRRATAKRDRVLIFIKFQMETNGQKRNAIGPWVVVTSSPSSPRRSRGARNSFWGRHSFCFPRLLVAVGVSFRCRRGLFTWCSTVCRHRRPGRRGHVSSRATAVLPSETTTTKNTTTMTSSPALLDYPVWSRLP